MGGAAVNFAELAEEDRPDLPTRSRPGGALEVQCPACNQWRAAFLIESDGADSWHCDAERAAIARAVPPGLDALKARQREEINRARDVAIDGGAVTPAGPVDTNLQSRVLIAGAAQAAMIAASQQQAFQLEWTLADNSAAELDGQGIIALGLAVAAHVDAMHQRARVLKARIDAAEDAEGVAAITWTLEDPE
jgi:hypothetical protein